MSEHRTHKEPGKQHFAHRSKQPRIDPSVFLATGSQVSGDVEIGKDSSIWFNTVIRADVNFVRIGESTNIQDLSLVHVSYKASPTVIGHHVTVGHSVVLHACTIGSFVLVGMGSIVLDDVEIADHVLLGAGSLVTQKTKIPAGTKAFGRPARVVGDLSEKEIEQLRWSAEHYVMLARAYRGL